MYIDKDLLDEIKLITGKEFNEIATYDKDLFRVREINVLSMLEELCNKYREIKKELKETKEEKEDYQAIVESWE